MLFRLAKFVTEYIQYIHFSMFVKFYYSCLFMCTKIVVVSSWVSLSDPHTTAHARGKFRVRPDMLRVFRYIDVLTCVTAGNLPTRLCMLCESETTDKLPDCICCCFVTFISTKARHWTYYSACVLFLDVNWAVQANSAEIPPCLGWCCCEHAAFP